MPASAVRWWPPRRIPGPAAAIEAIEALGLADDDGDWQDDDGLAELTAQLERALGQQGGPAGLLELRPGAPLRDDIRILFAVEPPGTALLIAVRHGLDVVEDQFSEAVLASADMLRRVRDGQAPEAAARTYADTRSFLAEFYPGDDLLTRLARDSR